MKELVHVQRIAAGVLVVIGFLSRAEAETVSADTTWGTGTHSTVVVENATLTIDGEAESSGTVDIGSSNGGGTVDIVSGYLWAASYRFGVTVPASFTGDYLNKVFVRSGGKAYLNAGFSHNGKFPSLMTFDGGLAQFSTYAERYLFSCATTNLTLRGVNGHDISLFFSFTGGRTLNWLKDWSDTNIDMRLRTEGDCDVVLDGNDMASIRMQTYGSTKDKLEQGYRTVDGHHTGDLVLMNRIAMTLDGDMMLPFGAQTGGVTIKGKSTLDFNGRRTAVNSLSVASADGRVMNTASGPATVVLGLNDRSEAFSQLFPTGAEGVFHFEKAGLGTMTVDRGELSSLRVSGGAVSFVRTSATPADGRITVSELVVDSPDMTTLLVDGVNLTCSSVSGAALGKLVVVLKNGGTFDYGTMASPGSAVRDPAVAAGETLVKTGPGVMTVVSEDALAGSLDVREGVVRFRAPFVTGGTRMLVRYTFKKTSGTNQPLMLEELKLSGLNSAGTATENIFAGHSDHATRYPIRSSVAEVYENGGMWVSGTYVESSTGTNVPLKYTPDWLFDNGTSSSRVYSPNDTIPVPGDPSTWQQIVARVYWWNPATRIKGYNFAKALFQKTTQGLPVSWQVEASTNGVNWSVIGEETDVTPAEVGQWSRGWVGATDFKVVGLGPDKGFSASSAIRVDAGATLDLEGLAPDERVISKLVIDFAKGGGTITDFNPAESGVLQIVNVGTPKLTTDKPLMTFDRCANAERVKQWTVLVDGTPARGKLQIRNGKLYLTPPGLLVVFR